MGGLAALLEDGRVYAWGDQKYGGNPEQVLDQRLGRESAKVGMSGACPA